MQQTALDRWLKEHFVLETHVNCLSAPPYVPSGVKLQTLEINLKNRFRYKMIIRNRKELEKALQALTDANQTFTTQVLPRRSLARLIFDDPNGGSFTYKVLWLVLLAAGVVSLVIYFPWSVVDKLQQAYEFLIQYM